MSLKTFLKAKVNLWLLGLTALAVGAAGVSLSSLNSNPSKVGAVDANDGHSWGLIGSFSGNSWSSDVCSTTAHGDSSAQGYESATGTKTLGPYNIPAGTAFKIRADNSWTTNIGGSVLNSVNSTYFASGDNATINSGYGGYYTFVLSGNLYNYTNKSYGVTAYYNSSSSSVNVSEYRVLGSTLEGSSFHTDTASLGVLFTPTTPSAVSGYAFEGWYTNSSCTTAYSNGRFSASTTLYAHFTSTAVTHTVSLYKHYSDDSTNVYLTQETATEGVNYTPAATPSATSYTWDSKWYTDSACTSQYTATSITANTSLYAKMVRSAGYTISEYRVLDGTASASTFATETTTLGSSFTPATSTAYDNYIFTGWFTDSACSTAYAAKTWTAAGSLYAGYVSKFSLRNDGTSWSSDDLLFSYSSGTYSLTTTFTAGEQFKAYKMSATTAWFGTSASGYSSSFSSMYFSGSDNIVSTYAYKFTITFTYTSSGGFTWTGCTLVPNTYTVSEYRVLGSTVASTAFATATATQGTAFAVPSQPADTPTGYTWDGWYTDSACTSAYTSRLWTADGNLYAHYTALVVYEAVVFDAYKGSADAATYYGYGSTYSTLLLASESATSGIAFTPTSTPASRTDYTFSGNWYTDPQCTTAFTSGTLSANTYLFAKYTLTDTSVDAIYLMLSSKDSSFSLCLPAYRFTYNSTTTRYEICQTFSSTSETFKFFDATRTNTLGSNVYGGYFASAFKYDEFTGTTDSAITVATSGTYTLSIRYNIASASTNFYGYWYEALKDGADYSGADIYLRGPYSDYTSDRNAYKFAYNSTYGDYELDATLTAADAIFFYYGKQSARGGWNAAIFGTTNFNQGALVDSTYRINVATSGTYRLHIKGSIAVAQSGSDWASYWWSVESLSEISYGYATEYRVLAGTAEDSAIDIEKGVVGASFTPQALAVPTGYQLKGWSTSKTTYTAYSATNMTSSGMLLYCWFEVQSYTSIYFAMPDTATNFGIGNLRLYLWGDSGVVLGGFPGVDPTSNTYSVSSKLASDSTTANKVLVPNPTSTSNITYKLYQISIPSTTVTNAGANRKIIVSWNNGTTYQSNDLSFVENGCYWRDDSTFTASGERNSHGGYFSDFGFGAKLAFDTYTAITSATATNGNGSVCGISSATADSLYASYQALTGTALSLFNSSTMNQYTKQASSPIWNGSHVYTNLQATMSQIYKLTSTYSGTAFPGGVRSSESSISLTLIIVASCGVSSLLAIAGIYLFSRKKKRHPDSMA